MSLPPPHHPKPQLILSERVLITVTTPDGVRVCDREGRESAGMVRHGDHFIMEIVAKNGTKLQIKFTHDALADHRDRVAGMLA